MVAAQRSSEANPSRITHQQNSIASMARLLHTRPWLGSLATSAISQATPWYGLQRHEPGAQISDPSVQARNSSGQSCFNANVIQPKPRASTNANSEPMPCTVLPVAPVSSPKWFTS